MTRIYLFFFLLFLAFSFTRQTINKRQQILAFYQVNSHIPIIHVHHDRHFTTSRQFEDFLQVIEEFQYRNKDYVKIIFTDCEEFAEESYACRHMRETKQNRMVLGQFPSNKYTNFGGKRMQSPPVQRSYDHPRDVYTVQEIQSFLKTIVPSFFTLLKNQDQFQEWLKPRYSPKLLLATREDQVPYVLNKLSVAYYLRFDMAYVSDLTQSVITKLNIKKFPTLLVLKYNFTSNGMDFYEYDQKDFSQTSYESIKTFLQPLALSQPRNDLVFHRMQMPTQEIFRTTDSLPQITQYLDQASGWALIQHTKGTPSRLLQFKQQYGRFFEYYHFIDGEENTSRVDLYDPSAKKTFELQGNSINFRPLNAQEFLTNTTGWLRKDYLVMAVREKYGHLCSLSLFNVFRGLTMCFIVDDDAYPQASKQLNNQFQIGFVAYNQVQGTASKVKGQAFNTAQFAQVYQTAQYQVRMKAKLMIDHFINEPITLVTQTNKLQNLCDYPSKKCALLFTSPLKKDRTAYDYLADIATNFINEYKFYQIDLSCNQEFTKEIPALQQSNGGLVVYHVRQNGFVSLKAKLSKSNFQKFLKANLGDSNKLPLKTFQNAEIQVNGCIERKQTEDSTPSQQQQDDSGDSEQSPHAQQL